MNMYHITYVSTAATSADCYVVASTQANATVAAQAADSNWVQLISISQIAANVIVGS
jgi:hypothetical protein